MRDALGGSNHPCCDDVMVPSTIKKVRPKGAKFTVESSQFGSPILSPRLG